MKGTSTPGNKSETIPSKRGKSCSKNFGTFESLIAQINKMSSGVTVSLLLKVPAMTSTDLTALIPKS